MHKVHPAVFDALAEAQVRRKLKIRSTTALSNAIGALVRRGMGWDLTLPERERNKIESRATAFVKAVMTDGAAPEGEDPALFDSLGADIDDHRRAMQPLVEARGRIEGEMRRMAKALPVWQAFAEDVAGLGDLGLAVIVGECGDLDGYDGPQKVWRRLGLAPYKGHAGKAWRIEKWRPRALTAAEWTEYGYSGRRLAQIFGVVTAPLFRAQSAAKGPYRAIYDARRAHTAVTRPDWTKGHSHNDGMRIMTKTMIRDLWCAWHGRSIRTPQERPGAGQNSHDVQGTGARPDSPDAAEAAGAGQCGGDAHHAVARATNPDAA